MDTAAYWKAEYRRSEDTQVVLRVRVTSLERELGILKGGEASEASIALNKRKEDDVGFYRGTGRPSRKKIKSATSDLAAAAGQSGLPDQVSRFSKESTLGLAGESSKIRDKGTLLIGKREMSYTMFTYYSRP